VLSLSKLPNRKVLLGTLVNAIQGFVEFGLCAAGADPKFGVRAKSRGRKTAGKV